MVVVVVCVCVDSGRGAFESGGVDASNDDDDANEVNIVDGDDDIDDNVAAAAAAAAAPAAAAAAPGELEVSQNVATSHCITGKCPFSHDPHSVSKNRLRSSCSIVEI